MTEAKFGTEFQMQQTAEAVLLDLTGKWFNACL